MFSFQYTRKIQIFSNFFWYFYIFYPNFKMHLLLEVSSNFHDLVSNDSWKLEFLCYVGFFSIANFLAFFKFFIEQKFLNFFRILKRKHDKLNSNLSALFSHFRPPHGIENEKRALGKNSYYRFRGLYSRTLFTGLYSRI